VGAS
jgi:hypothetical protein